MPNREDEKKLDKELKDTFPASDPTSGNVFVGAPPEPEEDAEKNPENPKGKNEK